MLDASIFANSMESSVNGVDPQNPDPTINETIAQHYFDYSLDGETPGADYTGGGTKSILDGAFLSDNSPAMASQLATEICAYWATCGEPGIPANGGTVVQSVTVTPTPANVLSMQQAIEALITDQSTPNAFLLFSQAMEVVVKTIPVVVVELVNGTPTPFPGFIS